MRSHAAAAHAVHVRTRGEGGYPVLVGRGLRHAMPELLAEYAPAHRYAVIADSNVARLHGSALLGVLAAAGARAELFTFPAGEEHKIRRSWSRLSDELLAAGFGRDGCVVALGGGVTGDLGGFVAATLLRGIPVVQVPTSLVAMVDASVGGKTGVDTRAGKNLIGAFHPPRVVVADPDYLYTLPAAERAQGLAEAVKHGAILDEGYFEEVGRSAAGVLAGDGAAMEAVVRRSVELKARVVSEDEREGGLRQLLNFGHTLGHALEAESGYTLPHGSAVSLGMILEARAGERIGRTRAGTADRLSETLASCSLPTVLTPGTDAAAVLARTPADKKTRAGSPSYVLLDRIGRVDGTGGWTHALPDEVVLAVLGEAR